MARRDKFTRKNYELQRESERPLRASPRGPRRLGSKESRVRFHESSRFCLVGFGTKRTPGRRPARHMRTSPQQFGRVWDQLCRRNRRLAVTQLFKLAEIRFTRRWNSRFLNGAAPHFQIRFCTAETSKSRRDTLPQSKTEPWQQTSNGVPRVLRRQWATD